MRMHIDTRPYHRFQDAVISSVSSVVDLVGALAVIHTRNHQNLNDYFGSQRIRFGDILSAKLELSSWTSAAQPCPNASASHKWAKSYCARANVQYGNLGLSPLPEESVAET